MTNRITKLLNVKYPIIQGGMVWVSGWKLASAVSNCGGLGLIGSGSMKPDLLTEHIRKCKLATKNQFGVNLPLMRKDSDELINTILNEKIEIIFSSAGNPQKHIEILKQNKCIVIHVVSNLKQGLKAQSVGCDAVVAEGVEAGGHNGLDQLTMLKLTKQLAENLMIPVIAAGGIVDKKDIRSALNSGAEGVQIGTLFASSEESSAHQNYKDSILLAGKDGTRLILKKIGLTRAIKNDFTEMIHEKEKSGSTSTQLKKLLGEKREKLGIFNGNKTEGLLEAGTGVEKISKIRSVREIFDDFIEVF